jgi:hypothetical protein
MLAALASVSAPGAQSHDHLTRSGAVATIVVALMLEG